MGALIFRSLHSQWPLFVEFFDGIFKSKKALLDFIKHAETPDGYLIQKSTRSILVDGKWLDVCVSINCRVSDIVPDEEPAA